MSYQPYPIAKYSTGLDEELQPWLLPEDAFVRCFDAYLVRGVLRKRDGYSGLANGERGGSAYCESRMVSELSSIAMTGAVDSANQTYTTTASETPIRRGSFVVTSATPSQTVTDDGVGGFSGDGTGTIDYDTGAVSVTFTSAPTAGSVTATYSWHPDEPVMGVMNYYTSTNIEQLFVANEKRVNLYNTTTNRLDYVGRTGTITAVTTASPAQVTSASHGLQTGDRVYIYNVSPDSSNEINNQEFTVTKVDANNFTIGSAYTDTYSSGGTFQQIFSGDNKNFWSWDNYLSADDNPRLIFTNNNDNIQIYDPTLTPSFIDYVSDTGTSFAFPTIGGNAVLKLQARHVLGKQERMLLFNVTATTSAGTFRYHNRIWISGPGGMVDDYTDTVNGAGFIDLDDGSEIMSVQENRDDIFIQTRLSTYLLKYTGNDVVPFEPILIDGSVGSDAPFGSYTRFNTTWGSTRRKLTVSDGYKVNKSDDKIEEYSYRDIDATNFDLCFAGIVEDDHQIYLLHPAPDETESSRILAHNYEEDSWSVQRIGLSCMGQYQQGYDLTWADLSIYSNWEELGARFNNWDAFAWMEGAPYAVGGGHHGEVWKLNVTQSEDNPQKVRNMSLSGTSLTVTTDWNNYAVGDYIYFSGVSGMVETNNQQYPITSITNNYTFVVSVPSGTYSSYTSGGTASKVIQMDVITKKYNPYLTSDKKVKCGWLYMYVDVDEPFVTRNIEIADADQSDPCLITTLDEHNLQTGQYVRIFGVGGMTEINGFDYQITVVNSTSFTLNGIDAAGFTAYTSGGYAAVREEGTIEIQIINNTDQFPQVTSLSNAGKYIGNTTNLITQTGSKKWYKLWINQVGQFIQFRFLNNQAGSNIRIQSHMPGFQPVGRLI